MVVAKAREPGPGGLGREPVVKTLFVTCAAALGEDLPGKEGVKAFVRPLGAVT